MQYGEHVKFFRILQQRGQPTPFDQYPNNTAVAEWYVDHYNILAKFSKDGITLPNIAAYLEMVEPIGTKEQFIQVISKIYETIRDHQELLAQVKEDG